VTPLLRLLFDDCLSKRAVEALKTLASYSDGAADFAHLADLALSGQQDDEWIPKIEKTKIIVSTDRGRKNHGGKLPLICQREGITHVLFSGSVHKLNTFDKIRAMFAVWPDLLNAAVGSTGCGYILKVRNRGEGFELLSYFTPPSREDEPKTKQLDLPKM